MPVIDAASLHGLVLAGGFSRRMGRDKGALRIHDRPQVEHMAQLLAGVCESVAVSARPEQPLPTTGWLVITDREPGSGPLGAIVSAQASLPGVAWLVVACDLPFVTTAALSHLVSHRDPSCVATCYLSEHDGLPEPCCAIYEPHAAKLMGECFAGDMRCPRKVLMDAKVRTLRQVVPGALDNINTPEELDAAVLRLSGVAS